MEALHLCEAVDLVQVVEDVGWRGVRIDGDGGTKKGKAAAFPVSRGTLIGLGPRDALLWTHGDVRGISEGGSYFQGVGALRVRFALCGTLATDLGRHRTRRTCAFEDGLEQRRSVRPATRDHRVREGARASGQAHDRFGERALPVPVLHVARSRVGLLGHPRSLGPRTTTDPRSTLMGTSGNGSPGTAKLVARRYRLGA